MYGNPASTISSGRLMVGFPMTSASAHQSDPTVMLRAATRASRASRAGVTFLSANVQDWMWLAIAFDPLKPVSSHGSDRSKSRTSKPRRTANRSARIHSRRESGGRSAKTQLHAEKSQPSGISRATSRTGRVAPAVRCRGGRRADHEDRHAQVAQPRQHEPVAGRRAGTGNRRATRASASAV